MLTGELRAYSGDDLKAEVERQRVLAEQRDELPAGTGPSWRGSSAGSACVNGYDPVSGGYGHCRSSGKTAREERQEGAIRGRGRSGRSPSCRRRRGSPSGSEGAKAAARKRGDSKGTGSGAGAHEVTELRRAAARLGIEGRSKIGKAQLIRAVGQKRRSAR